MNTQDRTTNKQESLGISDKAEAVRLLNAKNESAYHPAFNIHLARTYLSAADPTVALRTWRDVMDAMVKSKVGEDPSTVWIGVLKGCKYFMLSYLQGYLLGSANRFVG